MTKKSPTIDTNARPQTRCMAFQNLHGIHVTKAQLKHDKPTPFYFQSCGLTVLSSPASSSRVSTVNEVTKPSVSYNHRSWRVWCSELLGIRGARGCHACMFGAQHTTFAVMSALQKEAFTRKERQKEGVHEKARVLRITT